MRINRTILGIGTVLLLLAGSVVAGPVVGANTEQVDQPVPYQTSTVTQDGINVTTEYPNSDMSQGVDVYLTISPTETEITEILVAVSNTDSAFVDFDSFGVAISPSGAANVEETLQSRGGELRRVYSIDSLETDQSVTITFTAYPRQLQSSNNRLDVAQVNYQYLRNGVQIPDNPPARVNAVADLSSSPANEAQNLQTMITGLRVTIAVSVLLGLVGIGAAAWMFFTRDTDTGPSRSTINDISGDIEDLEARLRAVGEDEAREEAKEIKDKVNELKY